MYLTVGEEAVLFVLADEDPLGMRGNHSLPAYNEIVEARIGLQVRKQSRPTCNLRIWRITFKPTSSRVESSNVEF